MVLILLNRLQFYTICKIDFKILYDQCRSTPYVETEVSVSNFGICEFYFFLFSSRDFYTLGQCCLSLGEENTDVFSLFWFTWKISKILFFLNVSFYRVKIGLKLCSIAWSIGLCLFQLKWPSLRRRNSEQDYWKIQRPISTSKTSMLSYEELNGLSLLHLFNVNNTLGFDSSIHACQIQQVRESIHYSPFRKSD